MATSEPPHLKLHMIWPRQRRTAPAQWPVPDGYSMRTYHEGDKEQYIRLMRSAGFDTWDETRFQDVIATMHTQGLFFVVHDATQALVATSAAQSKEREFYPNGGELGWVAAHPDHRGKGLGYVVCSAVTRRLLAEDHPFLYLLTDDFRLPAIRVYLNLGWIPHLYTPEVEALWRSVCAKMGLRYEDVETTTNAAGVR
jgi:mycothiol synthase